MIHYDKPAVLVDQIRQLLKPEHSTSLLFLNLGFKKSFIDCQK